MKERITTDGTPKAGTEIRLPGEENNKLCAGFQKSLELEIDDALLKKLGKLG